MRSARAERTRSAENEGLGANPVNRAPILECTTHQFTTREGIDEYRAQAQSRSTSAQSRCTDGPPAPRLDQANMENESDSLSRTIRLMIREARDSTEGLDPDNNIFPHTGVKMLHPEPYAGEANLERFEVFVAALL